MGDKSIMCDIKAERITLRDLVKNNSYIIPYYQRKYSWDKENCEELFYDILPLANPNPPQQVTHFMSNITLAPLENGKFYVVDGQQRITTLYLFLHAYANYTESNLNTEYEISANLHFEDHVDQRTYRSISKGLFCEQESLSINMHSNYEFFYKKINEKSPVFNEEAINNILENLLFVKVELPPELAPQRIFERMNSSKLDIEQMDLIKNFLLMKAGIKDEKEIYELWHKGLSYGETEWYITLIITCFHNKVIPRNMIYKEFKLFYDHQITKFGSISEFVEFILPKDSDWKNSFDKDIKESLYYKKLYEWDSLRLNHCTYFLPLLFKICIAFNSDESRKKILINSIATYVARSLLKHRWWGQKFIWSKKYAFDLMKKIDNPFKGGISFNNFSDDYRNSMYSVIIEKNNSISDEDVEQAFKYWSKNKPLTMINRFQLGENTVENFITKFPLVKE